VKSVAGIGLNDVTAAYGGAPGDLFALLLGQQLHIGGMNASVDLAERAAIGAGMKGIDLCCGSGATMRALVRFRDVASMVGIDATPRNVERGQQRCREEGLDNRIRFVLADACASSLAAASADFVWGEDAWCYVVDKPKLVAEAARLVRPGGTIAFTDWVEGPTALSDSEAERFLRLMSFANVEDTAGYVRLLTENGCKLRVAEDTGRCPAFYDLFVNMIEMQLTYDVLATVGFRTELLKIVTDNFRFLGRLARAGKLVQARFVAQRQG
jgi:ubiquinone/menaquinone biosynthesis C-methylase UbiE